MTGVVDLAAGDAVVGEGHEAGDEGFHGVGLGGELFGGGGGLLGVGGVALGDGLQLVYGAGDLVEASGLVLAA